MIEESLLIKQSLVGDTNSFSQLVLKHQVNLKQYLLSRCHNCHDADDVVQDTFINAYKYLHTYKTTWQFNTWLFTIANRLIAKQNKKYYRNHSDLTDCHASVELEELTFDKDNIWIQVKKVVSSQSYDVLWFFYVEELPVKEIAKILQRSTSWVKINLYRSKKKLSVNSSIRTLSRGFLREV
jgi:RNA polymerase sigma-70 factor (ECF subfamily)